jgi:hypothetical protein
MVKPSITKPFGSGWSPNGIRRVTPTSISRELGPVVYFIRTTDDLIKIGYTTQLAGRKSAFGVGWDSVLAITPGTRNDETALHHRFAQHLERGLEYFRPAPDLIQHINQLRAALGVSPIAA